MGVTMATDTESPQQARKRAYNAVVETLRGQTGDKLGWLIREPSLRVTACSHGSLSPEEYQTALAAAVENGDVVSWHDQLVLGEEEFLRAAVVEEASCEHPRRGLVAVLNRRLMEVTET